MVNVYKSNVWSWRSCDDPVNERLCVGWPEGHRVTDDKPFLTLVYRGLYIKVI